LSKNDWVGVYSFSWGAREIAPMTAADPSARGGLIGRVGRMDADGETNLFAGLREGVLGVADVRAPGVVKHVIVISDGRASVGPTQPADLGAVAGWAADAGIQTTAVGVGTDYDEETLGRWLCAAEAGCTTCKIRPKWRRSWSAK
jgi:Ca-activated chloride channel homolog